MALVVGTNSYNDIVSAELYYADRMLTDEWYALDEPSKAKALVTGTLFMDTLCVWDNDKTDEDQDLSFPRNGDTVVPKAILVAHLEITLEMVKQQVASFVDSEDSLKQLKAGSVQLSFYEGLSTPITVVNSMAKSYLNPYGMCNFGGNSIQVVNTVR